jgi:cell division protein FtsX
MYNKSIKKGRQKMKYRILGACLILLFVAILAFCTLISFEALMDRFGEGEETLSFSLPLPFLLLFLVFPAISILIAALATVRSLRKIRNRENEVPKGEHKGGEAP